MNTKKTQNKQIFNKTFLLIVFLFLFQSVFALEQNFTSNLPIIVLDTNGKIIPDDPKIYGTMQIINGSETKNSSLSSKDLDYNGFIGIEIRGASSQIFPKKSFAVETRDEEGKSINVSLLTYPKESDWVLYAPFNDKSLLRNSTGYKLWAATGRYSPKSQFVEVILTDRNGKDLNYYYRGVYAFVEKVKRSTERVVITKMDTNCTSGDCLTGGYLLRVDAPKKDDVYFPTSEGKAVLIEYPKGKNLNPEQKTWITNYFKEFEQTVKSENYDDPINGYSKYIDVNSFVDYLLVAELTKHLEGFSFNFFLSKDKGGKLTAGPAWDFDRALGNEMFFYAWEPKGWLLDTYPNYFAYHKPPFWWYKLAKEKVFAQLLSERWKEMRQTTLSDEKILQMIGEDENTLLESQVRNFEKWPILGKRVGSNPSISPLPQTFADEVNYVRTWLITRANWMDTHVDSYSATCGNDIIEAGEDCDFGSDNNIITNHCIARLCTCDFGFEKVNGKCVPVDLNYTCTAPSETGLIICPEDNLGLTRVWKSTVVGKESQCSVYAKCEYYCADGYAKKGRVCVDQTPVVKPDTNLTLPEAEEEIQENIASDELEVNASDENSINMEITTTPSERNNLLSLIVILVGVILITIVFFASTKKGSVKSKSVKGRSEKLNKASKKKKAIKKRN